MNPPSLFRILISSFALSFIIAQVSCAADRPETNDQPPPATAKKPAGDSGNTANNSSSGKDNKDDKGDYPATDPGYRLAIGDEVSIAVYNEGDISTTQRIDERGIVRIYMLGEVNLNGKPVREAERYLEKLLIDKKILVNPMVSVTVHDYAPREVSVLGAFNATGKYRMPRDETSVDIIDVVTSMGGFKPAAKSDEVKVTHTEDGKETVSTVNVEAMMRGGRNAQKSFLIYPGDRIYVPERLF